MSCPTLHPDTLAECTQAAYHCHPAYYCVFSWVYAEPPPGPKYLKLPLKWLQAHAWRAMGEEQPDQHLLSVSAESGPELLRNLRAALAGFGKVAEPPAPLPRAPGNGWIASAKQTTQAQLVWPT